MNGPTLEGLPVPKVGPCQGRSLLFALASVGFTYGYSQSPASREQRRSSILLTLWVSQVSHCPNWDSTGSLSGDVT